MRLPITLQNSIIEFLKSLPNIDDSKNQRAFIYSIGLDTSLQEQIRYADSSAQFVPLLVDTLVRYGKLSDGQYALEAVLHATKNYIGQDKRVLCEHLIHELHASVVINPKNRTLAHSKNTSSFFSKHRFHLLSIIFFLLLVIVASFYSIWRFRKNTLQISGMITLVENGLRKGNVQGAKVSISGYPDKSVITDADGKFSFELSNLRKPKKFDLMIEYDGKTLVYPATLDNIRNVYVEIEQTPIPSDSMGIPIIVRFYSRPMVTMLPIDSDPILFTVVTTDPDVQCKWLIEGDGDIRPIKNSHQDLTQKALYFPPSSIPASPAQVAVLVIAENSVGKTEQDRLSFLLVSKMLTQELPSVPLTPTYRPKSALIINPDVVEVPVGSDIIPLQVQIEGNSIQYLWKLEGLGVLEGDCTQPAIFYRPPDKIEGDSVGVIISVHIITDTQQEVRATVLLKIISSDTTSHPLDRNHPSQIPEQLIVSIPHDSMQPMLIALNEIDDFQFVCQVTAIPEPNTFLLFSMGVFLFIVSIILKSYQKRRKQ